MWILPVVVIVYGAKDSFVFLSSFYMYVSNDYLATSNIIMYFLSISFHQYSIYWAPIIYIRCGEDVNKAFVHV